MKSKHDLASINIKYSLPTVLQIYTKNDNHLPSIELRECSSYGTSLYQDHLFVGNTI